ncbi:MAG: hypothetical protein AMXMBFR57_10420 [Acidimicrobiia bacterium]
MTARTVYVVAMWVSLLCVAEAGAQTPRWELTPSLVVDGPASMGTTRAVIEAPSGADIVLFTAESRSTTGLGAALQVSHRLGARWRVGVNGSWSRPSIETHITGDLEGADDETATVGLHRFVIAAQVERTLARRGKAEWVVGAGAGWLRQLTSDRAVTGNGFAAHAGGGLKYWMRDGQPGWLGRIALRVDARLALRRDGVSSGDQDLHWSPQAFAGLVIAR